MAEIKIEKKSPVWPWIIAALLIVGALLYFFVLKDDNNDNGLAGAAAGTTEETRAVDKRAASAPASRDSDEVGQYVQYVNEHGNMDLDHEYTNDALLQLTEAVRAKAGQLNHDIQADLEQVEELAGQIQQDPFETTHATKIRSAADILANAMANMQQQHYPDLNDKTQEVKQAAGQIEPNTLTLDQRDAVKGFFHKSAILLQSMQ